MLRAANFLLFLLAMTALYFRKKPMQKQIKARAHFHEKLCMHTYASFCVTSLSNFLLATNCGQMSKVETLPDFYKCATGFSKIANFWPASTWNIATKKFVIVRKCTESRISVRFFCKNLLPRWGGPSPHEKICNIFQKLRAWDSETKVWFKPAAIDLAAERAFLLSAFLTITGQVSQSDACVRFLWYKNPPKN